MHLYLWFLFVILATARAESESESRQIGYAMPLSAAECGCRAIQSKPDQQDQHASQMFHQQEKKTESILNGQFKQMDQLEQRLSLMFDKLDQQEHRITKMFNQQKKDTESTLNGQFIKQDQLKQRVSEKLDRHQNVTRSILNDLFTKMDQLEHRVSQMMHNQERKTESVLSGLVAKFDQLLEDRVSQMLERQQNATESILNEWKQVVDYDESINLAQQNLTQQCAVSASGDSNASLPIVNNVDVNVRKCQECQYVDIPFGPNWIVIFQRIDDSGNFGRPWKDYRDGFGTVGQHFWLGLEKMHQLTKDSPYELVVEMTEYYYGEKGYARYDQFQIGSEAQKYPLKLGTHSGLAGDGLADHKSMTFSTYDSGKDIGISKTYGNAGWWFYGSWSSYLTGGKNDSSKWPGMWWYKFKSLGHTRLSSARMMIRAI